MKLNLNQIDELVNIETGLTPEKPLSKKSIFRFKINETVENLIYFIKHPWEEDDWDYVEYYQQYNMVLADKYFNCAAVAKYEGGELEIITGWSSFVYRVKNTRASGAEVLFEGPLNALLRQNLLPDMTYVSGTLEGKYEDMEDFVSISQYCLERERRHAGKTNPQDGYGYLVNRKFNNEIPAFPFSEE